MGEAMVLKHKGEIFSSQWDVTEYDLPQILNLREVLTDYPALKCSRSLIPSPD